MSDSTTPRGETISATLSIYVALVASVPSTVDLSTWSGYVVGDGPYTSVIGTFDVPSTHTSSTNTNTNSAKWVAIDGAYPGGPLLQAGIG